MKSAIMLTFVVLGLGACRKDAVPAEPRIRIQVDGLGFHPDEVKAPAGQLVHLTFVRTSDDGCGQQLIVPSLDLHKDLPLDREVALDLAMPATGRLEFTCGMGMLRGAVVAVP